MDNSLKEIIEVNYGFKIGSVKNAPRQFVAETFIIENQRAEKYFVKVVEKRLFIPEIIRSLPALNELNKIGAERIIYPIRTITNQLYIFENNLLIVLFNYIDALQSYDYDSDIFGETIAKIHSISQKVNNIEIPKENFDYSYKEEFETNFNSFLKSQHTKDDLILIDLLKLLQKYENRVRFQYEKLFEFAKKAKLKKNKFVITHGDAGGNILVKSKRDIYIIDWDGLLLAPPERDIWVSEENEEFLDGYRRVFPDFNPDRDISNFFTLQYYFNSFAQYLAEIISNKDEVHRKKNLKDLEFELFEGWMKPYLIKINVSS